MINLKDIESLKYNCSYKSQLSRISYALHPLRERKGYYCYFLEGVGIFNKNDVVLLGNKVTCFVEYIDESNNIHFELITNNTNYKDTENIVDTFLTENKNTFLYSLIELFKYKTLRLNSRISEQKQDINENGKSAILTLLLKDNSTLELNFEHDLVCTYIKEDLTKTQVTEQELLELIKNNDKILQLTTRTVSPRGSREIILKNNFTDILRELFYFINRTLILDYSISTNEMRRCIVFDKQVVEIQMTSKNCIAMTTYSINKFNYGFPDSIICNTDSIKDINYKIMEYADEHNIHIDRKRR